MRQDLDFFTDVFIDVRQINQRLDTRDGRGTLRHNVPVCKAMCIHTCIDMCLEMCCRHATKRSVDTCHLRSMKPGQAPSTSSCQAPETQVLRYALAFICAHILAYLHMSICTSINMLVHMFLGIIRTYWRMLHDYRHAHTHVITVEKPERRRPKRHHPRCLRVGRAAAAASLRPVDGSLDRRLDRWKAR